MVWRRSKLPDDSCSFLVPAVSSVPTLWIPGAIGSAPSFWPRSVILANLLVGRFRGTDVVEEDEASCWRSLLPGTGGTRGTHIVDPWCLWIRSVIVAHISHFGQFIRRGVWRDRLCGGSRIFLLTVAPAWYQRYLRYPHCGPLEPKGQVRHFGPGPSIWPIHW